MRDDEDADAKADGNTAAQDPFGLEDVSWDGLRRLDCPDPLDPVGKARARARGPRRLATSLVFATLFFAGAALSAGAGDVIANAVDDGTTAAAETATTETTDTTATDESTGGESSSPADDGTTGDTTAGDDSQGTPPETTGDDGSADQPGDAGEPSDPADPGAQPGGQGDGPAENGGDQSGAPGAGTGSGSGGSSDGGGGSGGSHNAGGGSHHQPAGPALVDSHSASPTDNAPLEPEVSEAGVASTIWLHRTMPDPTPASRRLTPAFARVLRIESRRAHADWALVLGVLRAQGHNGRRPATRAAVRSLAERLGRLTATNDDWAAVLAWSGRTAFADRAVALARVNRAVGLHALVAGLEAAKRDLEQKTLLDPRVTIYPGGRDDLVAHRIDVRVLVAIRYLAEAFGQVTVSCLESGHRLYARPGVISAHVYGLAADISAVGGTPIVGHQQPGGITEQAVRDVLLLPAGLEPKQVISLLGLGGPSFPLADHYDHIHIGF
jgi:hypothetical protein